MRLLAFNTALAALLIASPHPATAQTNADARFTLAMSAYRQDGDVARARVLLTETLQLDPKHKAAAFNLALLAEGAEDWDSAVKWYGTYQTLDADGPYAATAAAKIAMIQSYTEADKTPDGKKDRIYRQYIDRSRSHLVAGRPGAAIAMAEIAAETDSSRYEAYAAYGAALMQAERFGDAGAKLDLALARAPASEKAALASMATLARKYLSYQGDLAKADADYQSGRYQAAAETYGRVWTLVDDPVFAFQAADAWALASRRDKAGDIYAALAKSKDTQVAARAQGEVERLANGSIGSTLDPQRDAALASLASPAFQRAEQQLAAKNYYGADTELSLLIQPIMPDAAAAPLFEKRAAARIGAQDYLSALQDLTMALLLAPQSRSALDRRAGVLAKLGRPGEAARDVERLIEMTSDVAERKRLGELRAQYLSEENSR